MSDIFKIILVSIIRFESLVKTIGYSNLSRHIIVITSGFMDLSYMADDVLGTYCPANLPACSVEHFAGRENGDSLLIVISNISK
jgi:hypothetical protein